MKFPDSKDWQKPTYHTRKQFYHPSSLQLKTCQLSQKLMAVNNAEFPGTDEKSSPSPPTD
jgi:hypothetical protein